MQAKIILAYLIAFAMIFSGGCSYSQISDESAPEVVSVSDTKALLDSDEQETSRIETAKDILEKGLATFPDDIEFKNMLYDADGKLVGWTKIFKDFSMDGSAHWLAVFDYDINENLIQERHYYADGSPYGWYSYEYDGDGKQIKRISYNADGSINWWHINEFDADGNRVKITSYNAEGSVEHILEYDADGNNTQGKYYNSYGLRNWAVFEYDGDGNLVKIEDRNEDGSANWWQIYEYDIDGNRVKITSYGEDGLIGGWTIQEHDAGGRLAKSTFYDPDGSWVVREYDPAGWEGNSNGWLLTETSYNADGSINNFMDFD